MPRPLFAHPFLTPMLTTPGAGGPAGGDLTGVYPNPQIAPKAVTRAKTAADLWLPPIPTDPANVGQVLTVQSGPVLAWVTPAAGGGGGAPTGPATGDLGAVYPAPTVVKSSPAAGFPIYAGQSAPVFNFTFPSNAALLTLARPSVGIVKSRFQQATNEKLYITSNMDAGGNAFDDSTQPSWGLRWGDKTSDLFAIERAPANSIVWKDLFTLDNFAQVTLASSTTAGVNALTWGTAVSKGRVTSGSSSIPYVEFSLNRTINNTQDDATKPSWFLSLDGSGAGANPGMVQLTRCAAGNTSNQLIAFQVNGSGNVYVTGSTDTNDQTAISFGSRSGRGHLMALPGSDWVGMTKNLRYNGTVWAQDDPTVPSWVIAMTNADAVGFLRTPAGGTTPTSLLTLDNAGNLTINGATATKASGTTWANPSDERMKKNVAPYTRGLDAILALDPVTFEFNGVGGTEDGAPGIGFIAQAVQPVMPEMVHAMLEDDLLMLDTTALPLALVNAVKELADRLAALEAR